MIERDVIIAGAGPVGLTAALALRSVDRPVTVVEEGAIDRVRPGSRAIFIHRTSLLVLERIKQGLGQAWNSHGLLWQTRRTLYRGREVYRQTYPLPPADELPPATSLPQIVTEQVLLEACKEAGVEFIWDTPVRGARADQKGVSVETANGETMRSRYLIAADGSRSAVRESSGLRLEGPQTTNAFVIVDVAEDTDNPLPVERVFHYEDPAVEGRNILKVPFAGHWRVDLQCHATDDPDSFSGEDGVRRWLPNVMPAHYVDRTTWVSTYIFRQAVANNFTDSQRRILLTGEAAHVFAPFGARGLNSGIPDAYVAVTAVDKALNAASANEASAAVDHFAASRRAAALRNREASNTALHHLTAPTFGRRMMRHIAATASPAWKRAGKWLDSAPYGPRLGPPDADGMQY